MPKDPIPAVLSVPCRPVSVVVKVFKVMVALPVLAVSSTDVGRDTVYVVDGVPVS